MRKLLKQGISFLFAITIVLSSMYAGIGAVDFGSVKYGSVFALNAKAAASGSTGDCIWSLDGTVLTITGNGETGEYLSSFPAPWGTEITEVIIDDGVTRIGAYAFYKCASLVSVTVSDSVTSIGDSAFWGCKELDRVYIKDVAAWCNIRFDGRYYSQPLYYASDLYLNGELLTDLVVPYGVETIGDWAFCECLSLKSVVIPDSVKHIGAYSFYNCCKVTSVNIPDSVISIGDHAFFSCSGLTSVVVPDSVTCIEKYAFYYCENIESITLGKFLSDIGEKTFYNCKNLKRINIPDSVKSIGVEAFRDCKKLDSISIPNSVTSIGKGAFRGCISLISVNIPENVTKLESEVFLDCEKLATISLGDKIKSIGSYSFFNCRALNSFDIGDSITDIGEFAFSGCSGLTSVAIGNSVTNVGDSAFSDCTNLSAIIIPDSVSQIGVNAFANCEALEMVYITDIASWCGIDFLGKKANPMYYATALYHGEDLLENLVVPYGVTTIKPYAFYGCESLTSASIPQSVTVIGSSAFENCINLESITIPDNVTDINAYVFSGCENLTKITVGDGVRNIKSNAFAACSAISEVIYGCDYDCNLLYMEAEGNDYFANAEKSYTKHTADKWIIEDDSTCTTQGTKYAACKNCGAYMTDVVEIKTHQMQWVVVENPTCTQKGSRIEECSICGMQTRTEEMPELPHSAGDWIVDKESTCAEKGSKHTECENCGIYMKSIIEEKPHLTQWFDIEIPTCTKKGYRIEKCSVCGMQTQAVIVPEKSHTLGEWIISLSPSCTQEGLKYQKCSDCNEIVNSTVIAAIGHNYVEEVISQATCTVPGKKISTCLICGDSFETSIIGEHYIVLATINPTCTQSGKRGDFCLLCNQFIGKTTEFPASGHTSGDWIFDKHVTCTSEGSKYRACIKCGEVIETVTFPATGHTTGHWIVDSQPTDNTPGSQHKECIDCGKVVETATIPQLKPATPKVTSTNAIGGVQLNWNKVTGAVKYNVYRRGQGQSSFTYIGTTTGNTYTDKNVKSGQYYCYTVRAFNADGGYSAYVYANTSTRKYMATPKLTTIYNHQNGLAIKWNAVAGVTNGYRVYRRGAGQKTWTYLGTTKNLYFIDSQVKNRNGEYFRYTVIADGGYHSKFDTTGLYLRRLANPTLNSATSTSAGITVKWGKVAGSSGYYVYRKTANSTWTRVGVVSGVNNLSYLDKTAKKGTTYTYTVRAVYGNTLSAYYSGISCKDKY